MAAATLSPPPAPLPPADAPASPAPSGLGDVVHERVARLLAALSGSPVEGVYPVVMREVERALLEAVLVHTGGHREEAARILGLHRNSLRLRLRAVGLVAAAPERRKKARRRGGRS